MSLVSSRIDSSVAGTYSWRASGIDGTGGAAGGGGVAGAIAASSSRMSMAAGQKVMHRPQPTQPQAPNWSHHVANLWVSHWR